MNTHISGKPLTEWRRLCPPIDDLLALRETHWFNPAVMHAAQALSRVGLTVADIDATAARLQRFAPLLALWFADTRASGGIIESPLVAAPAMQEALGQAFGGGIPGKLWLKLDSALPVSGSIKARGGIHEVLEHAERLALQAGLIGLDDDYRKFAEPRMRQFLGRHRIAVGSTGNLGLSIGIMGAALGFEVCVHMSADARPWKKERLRTHGVTVIEHAGDYSAAVAQGRAQAQGEPRAHFIDDENSASLLLGYAVAGRRLAGQLQALEVPVDREHPLFVYLPCGVGGGPGGVTLGLKTIFGDDVHCILAEPTHSPCMLLGVCTGLHEAISVQDFGIDNRSAADGLAVGRPAAFVSRRLSPLIDGYITVADDTLFRLVARLHDSEAIDVEPSAAAGFPGPGRVLADDAYRSRMGLSDSQLARATHIVWATGGGMVPPEEMARTIARGQALLP